MRMLVKILAVVVVAVAASVSAAVGHDVLGTTSTNTQAEAQILIGSSLSGGLLLNADSGTGSSFDVAPDDADPTPTPTPTPDPTPSPTPTRTPAPDHLTERYSGTIQPGQSSVEIPFSLRRRGLEAKINQNHGNQRIYFELLDANGNLIAITEGDKIELSNLAPGHYAFRIRGNVTRAVDFTIKCEQDDDT